MATIDFSTLTEANFNGTSLTEINYNGTSVWTQPASYSALHSRIDIENGQTEITGWTPGDAQTASDAGPWYPVPSGVMYATSNSTTVMSYQGKLWYGKVVPIGTDGTINDALAWLEGYVGSGQVLFPSTGHINQSTYYSNPNTFMPLAEITYNGFVKMSSMPSSLAVNITVYEGQYGPSKDILRVYCSPTESLFSFTRADLNWSTAASICGIRHYSGGKLLQANIGPEMHLSNPNAGGQDCSVYSHYWGDNWHQGNYGPGTPHTSAQYPCYAQMGKLIW